MVINEFLVDPNPEWVEFYNASSSADYLKGYWLDDDMDFDSDSGSSLKKILSALKTDDATYPYLEFNSFLNNSGDFVVLFDTEGKIVDSFQYTSNPGKSVSIGRYPDRTGNMVALDRLTKGVSNSEPKPTPSPTPTPTAKPTRLPTSTPTPELTATSKKSLTTKPTIKKSKTSPTSASDEESDGVIDSLRDKLEGNKNENDGEVLGEETSDRGKVPLAAGMFVVAGLAFLGAAGYPLYKSGRIKFFKNGKKDVKVQ